MAFQEEFLRLLAAENKISLVEADEFAKEAVRTDKPIEDILVGHKKLNWEEINAYKARIFDLPYENLLEKEIPEEILNSVPQEVAENYQLICFAKDGSLMHVGLVDPRNLKAIEAIDFLAKKNSLKAKYYFISEDSYHAGISKYKNSRKEITSALELHAKEISDDIERRGGAENDGKVEIIKSAPIAKIVSVIILNAVEGKASDIHIEPLFNETRVRYRIDGILLNSLVLPKTIHNSIVARIKVMANMKLDETRVPQDGRIRQVVGDREIDFRVSTLPLMNEEKIVMRIFDVSRGAPSLDDLGFMGTNKRIILENTKKPFGLLLVTGPTGSGKSTTLFSVLNILNKEGINISTLEDPVEYHIKGANQSQVHPEVGFTFATGLRTLLRQDPDIIMVGEIRDSETAELAMHASLTGHFVLSTLHTNDAVGSIARLVDMKAEPFLLGSTLSVVIAQRLGRKICEFCKEKQELNAEDSMLIKSAMSEIPADRIKEIIPDFDPDKLVVYVGKGCPRCGGTGYSGRMAVCEVLDFNEKLRKKIIDKGASLMMDDVKETQTFIKLFEDGILKALLGVTTLDEIKRITQD